MLRHSRTTDGFAKFLVLLWQVTKRFDSVTSAMMPGVAHPLEQLRGNLEIICFCECRTELEVSASEKLGGARRM